MRLAPQSSFLCPRLGFEPGEPVIASSEPAKPPGHPLPDHLGVHLPPIGQDDFGHPPPAAIGVPGADRDGLAERQARCRLLGPIAEVVAGLRGVDAPSRMAPRPPAGWYELDWSILRQPARPVGFEVPEDLDGLENGAAAPVGAERQCV
jgi:hypothetical protein